MPCVDGQCILRLGSVFVSEFDDTSGDRPSSQPVPFAPAWIQPVRIGLITAAERGRSDSVIMTRHERSTHVTRRGQRASRLPLVLTARFPPLASPVSHPKVILQREIVFRLLVASRLDSVCIPFSLIRNHFTVLCLARWPVGAAALSCLTFCFHLRFHPPSSVLAAHRTSPTA